MKTAWLSLLLFYLIFLGPQKLFGADVAEYGIVKSIQYLQTNDAPALVATNAFMFTAFAVASSNHVVTNVTVKPANSTPLRTLTSDTNGGAWIFTELFNSQAAMDSVYPTGTGFSPVNYTMEMSTTNDGVRSATLSFYLLVFALSYPVTPQLTNLAAAQSIDTTRDFALGWNSLGGSSLAIVQLSILDSASNVVFASPAPFQPGALNGASGSMTIPSYALPPGTNLWGHLTIANPGNPNTNSYPGALGIAALAKDTQFPVSTRPAPQPPLLEVLAPNAGRFQLHLTGDTNRIFQIQAATDLRSWTNIFTTNCPGGAFDFSDGESPNRALRFYRGKVGQ
jgi:hypothetical protein